MKFTKLPVTIDATQWFKNGDHPLDNVFRPYEDTGLLPDNPREGAIVRYYRRPEPQYAGAVICHMCGYTLHEHGWIDTPGDGHTVCPGDWIITDIRGEHHPCKANIFKKTYVAATTSNKVFTLSEIISILEANSRPVGCRSCGREGNKHCDDLPCPRHIYLDIALAAFRLAAFQEVYEKETTT